MHILYTMRLIEILKYKQNLQSRTKILLSSFTILCFLFIVKQNYTGNTKREQKKPFDGSVFNGRNFDKALFINGPKFSQFEDQFGRLKSIRAVKKQASDLFYNEPEADEKFDTDSKAPDYYLKDNLVPAEVFYFWCSSNEHNLKPSDWFEYSNYLAVWSAIKAVHPDKVYIFYDKYPEQDRVIYHQWLDNLKKDFSGLYLYPFKSHEAENYCRSTIEGPKVDVILSLLDVYGGIFIGESTWLLNYNPDNRKTELDFAFNIDKNGKSDGFIMMKKGLYSKFKKKLENNINDNSELAMEFIKTFHKSFLTSKIPLEEQNNKIKSEDNDKINFELIDDINFKNDFGDNHEKRDVQYELKEREVQFSSCFSVQHLYNDENIKDIAKCLTVKGDAFDRFYPMDIWQLDDPFGRIVRKIFYGSERIRLPVPHYTTLVPNIGHMIWLGGRDIDFVFFLSLLSLLFVAKVDKVYVHGDVEPGGDLWVELKTLSQTKNRIVFVVRTIPYLIYQEEVEPYYYSLMSDLIRVDLMIKYGGIYTDTDAIWVKPLSLAERGYDAVASYDWIDWSWPYQDTVNFGVSYGKRDAPFWRIFRDSMRKLRNPLRGFTGVMMPYKLLEKYPELLRVDRRLSVICYHSRCHPTYFPGYHDEGKDHTNTNSIPDWRKDVHTFHWTHPNPTELFNKTVLLKSKGIFAELGKNVLKLAGLL